MPETPYRLPVRGQVFIEILIAISLISILGLTVFRLTSLSTQLISYSRARVAARHLGTERLELIRNLPYESVGTSGGIPSGPIAQVETIEKNGINYTIESSVIYVDDPYDQLAPTDTNSADFKRARVEVSWSGLAASSRNPIVFVTDVSSNLNVDEVEGGILNVLVFDASGSPLAQASVRITSSGITPAVDLTQETDSTGKVSLPGATECVACYRIVVTKTGYSSERTYSISEVTNPVKQDVGVFPNQITQISFAIDKVSTLTATSKNDLASGYSPAPGVSFNLRGNKIIGTDAYAQPVYKYDQAHLTDSQGAVTIQNLEWDVYQVYMAQTNPYDIAGTNALRPLNVVPDSTNSLEFVVAGNSAHSLLTIAKNPSLNLINGAYIRIFDGVGYDQTKPAGLTQTPDFGQAFFASLEEKTYQIEATASGYLNFSGEVIVSGDTLDEVVLTPE